MASGSLSTTRAVSQFTLLASTKKGKKPSFHRSAPEQLARDLYSSFFKKTKELYQEDRVKDGVFQAMMDVALVNDGPVGLDYRCEDEAVNIPPFLLLLSRAPDKSWLIPLV